MEWHEAAPARLSAGVPDSLTSGHEPAPAITVPASACPHTPAFARAGAETWYAAWWMSRPDSSAVPVVARSTDGGKTWTAPVPADTRDRGTRGCSRPAPALAADSATGYVYLAYFLEPRDGEGLWFRHSMEQGELWHWPIGIAFGDKPARANIAAQGDTVVVAFESPSRAPGASRVSLAVSLTAGHTFEDRLAVSGGSMAALDPRVALQGRTVTVSWLERPVGSDSAVAGLTMLRTGTLRGPT